MSTLPQTGIQLSIVIAASNGPALLERCLASLKAQSEAPDTEVIVVSNYGQPAGAVVRAHLPHGTHVSLSAATTVPALRTCGILRARGAVVALAEDHCTFAPNWCTALKEAHALPYLVVGGAIDNQSGRRPLDWAVFFYEYGRYMSPNPAGPVASLAGNNVSYKRAVLEPMRAHFEEGFFTTFVNQALREQGHTLYLAPAARVYHIKNYDASEVFRQCFHHGRAYAGMRVAEASWVSRILLALGALGLPALLPARIAWRILRKRKHGRELLMALPYLVFFMSSWACGELCGYVAGPGQSARHWT